MCNDLIMCMCSDDVMTHDTVVCTALGNETSYPISVLSPSHSFPCPAQTSTAVYSVDTAVHMQHVRMCLLQVPWLGLYKAKTLLKMKL